jgi:hypothetical protein
MFAACHLDPILLSLLIKNGAMQLGDMLLWPFDAEFEGYTQESA